MRRVVPGLGISIALLLLASTAAAETVHEIRVGSDSVNGAISDAEDVDRVPFRLPDGAVLSISLRAAKGSALRPSLRILGTDRQLDGAAMAALLPKAKGSEVRLKRFRVTGSGLRWLEIRGADGTTGGWSLAMRAKFPRRAAASGTTVDGRGEVLFTAPGSATADLSVRPARRSPVAPFAPELSDPEGRPAFLEDVTRSAKGLVARDVRIGSIGTCTLRFLTAEDGPFLFRARFRLDRFPKRRLAESDVVTDPVLVSLDPASGDRSQTLRAAVVVDFAEAGATVTFRRLQRVVFLAADRIAHVPGGVEFDLALGGFARGLYDLEFTNPDGGSDVLPDALTVEDPVARPLSMIPDSGFDTEVVDARIDGDWFATAAGVALVRDAERIPGEVLDLSPSTILARFDLRGRTIGVWDLVVTNPGLAPGVLPGAFLLRNPAPSVLAFSPEDDLGSTAFTGIVRGTDFDAVPTVRLTSPGLEDVAGTSVRLAGTTEVQAEFDTAGATAGPRDLVVTNPDGQSGTLPDAFLVTGPGPSPARASLTVPGTMDAPPALVWNSARRETAAAWIAVNGTATDVVVQRLDSSGQPVGTRVSVAASGQGIPKKDVALGWDSTNDQYLVAWSEPVTAPSLASTHPSYGYTSLYQIYAQRLDGGDLSALGGNVRVTDHIQSGIWFIDEFHNQRPTVAWNPKAGGTWFLAWMQEWSTRNVNNLGTDDYDVLARRMKADGTLLSLQQVATSGYREGDPFATWDPINGRILLAHTGPYGTTVPGPIGIYFGDELLTNPMVATPGPPLMDPHVCSDTASKQMLLTWTVQLPSGPRSVEGILVDQRLVNLVGNVTRIDGGTGENFGARPVYDPRTKTALVAWTCAPTASTLSVLVRRVNTSGNSISFAGSEAEISRASGDEGFPEPVPVGIGTAIYWLKTLSFTTAGNYNGSVTGGTWRGKELWMRRVW